jgi:thiamine biosynthesis lipoprotein
MAGRLRTGLHGRSLRRVVHGLGTTIDLRVWPAPGRERMAAARLAHAVAFLRWAEARLSRFAPNSELARLNRWAGAPMRVSRLMFAVIRAAVTAAEATGGLFDPTVLQALLGAGYDRSFDQLRPRPDRPDARPHDEAPTTGQWRAVRLDDSARTVWLPRGVGLDLGGIAKGWLADRLVRGLERCGAVYADMGGDVALSQPPPGAATWEIGIEDPRNPEALVGIVHVRRGGIATSGVTRRAWTAGGEHRHHLIDPRTGRPAVTDLLSVTVAAPTATAAEVAAKAVLLLGRVRGERSLHMSDHLAGVLLPAAGGTVVVGRRHGRPLVLERMTSP